MGAAAHRVPLAVDPSVASRASRDLAFTTYVLPELDVLLRVAVALTDQLADAEDLVQDTLIRAYRACDRFDGAHPRAWLLTILRRTHLNRLRGRRPGLFDDPEGWDDAPAPWPGGSRPGTPEEVVVGATFDTVVAGALQALPPAQRLVITLVDVDGLSYAEAARVAGIPEGTVMSRLHRARATIRTRLAEAGVVPPPRRGRGRKGEDPR